MNLPVLLARALLPGVLIFAAGLSSQASPEKMTLDGFFRKHLDAMFAFHPLEATRLGDHRFDGSLDDLSAEAQHRWLLHLQSTLRQLPREVDQGHLTRDEQIDFEILQNELTAQLWLTENTHPLEEDPRVYNDFLNDSIYLLLTQSTLPRETNITHALERMAQIPRVIEAARANLKNPPRAHTETAIRQNRGALAFYEKDLFELAGGTPQLPALRAAASNVLGQLKDYQRYLENDLLPRAKGDWRLGRAKFTRKLQLTLNAGMSADDVVRDAQAEFTRVKGEMYVIARQLWARYMTNRPVPPDDDQGHQEMILRVLAAVSQEHSGPETVTADVRNVVADIKEFIRKRDILRLPDPDRCQIIEMPEFQRGNSTAFMNAPPPLDPDAAGFYAVSPPPADWDAARIRSYFEEYNRHMIRILSIHEAYPGHYVQLEYANRNPSLIRKVLGSGVYIEGWAVYTEQTMLDQGYGDGDPALRLNQLKFYLRAVANAILDHRMHCDQMSEADAMDLLVRQSFQSEGEARLKVIRAQQSSVQLSTYFVGRMAHYRLRQSIEREWGDRFELGRYHEAVLAPGAVPVKYLPELVRQRLKDPR